MKEGFPNIVAECATLLTSGSEEQVATAMQILVLLHGASANKSKPKPKKPNT